MSCNFQKISFYNVKSILSNIISNNVPPENWNLIPDDLIRLTEWNDLNPKWQKIDWWEAFEYGVKEIPNEVFIDLLFHNIYPKQEKILIITDECFSDQMAYEINFSDLTIFIEVVYPEIHQMDFFQPNDYIFVFPESNTFITLHHEGHLLLFKSQKE